MAAEDEQQPINQHVTAVNGFAYGVIGADIHVFGDRMPVYLLERWRPPPEVDPQWLRELPSRMLNARFAVVDFTGRADELAGLRRWRDSRPRLAARWLHAPGGQGKTRLAAQLAQESLAEGWLVVTAVQGPGSVLPPPGSQDLRMDGATGLLLIVDYADQWPVTHLTWLFSNALLHRSAAPVRVLLLARSADTWPAVRASLANLANLRIETSTQPLQDLPDDPGPRQEMFRVARDSFAARYGLPDAVAVHPPGPLDDPDFGLTLALHMAALVAVDAHVNGGQPPSDMAGLTIYLLDREHLHWTRLHGDTGHDLNPAGRTYRTPPAVMNRTVFTAALTGALPHKTGTALVHTLQLPLPGEQVITDHSFCYPPADPDRATILEPLYPDRLAEDFLALTFPGHTADYPAQPWAGATADTLLTRDNDHTAPAWTPRAITFLANATQRWPHLGTRHLYPLLREDPELAVIAGNATLTTLARLSNAEFELLEAIESHFPDHRHVNLDSGIAAVASRLAEYRLATVTDPADRARVHDVLAVRLSYAGLHQRALAEGRKATMIWQLLARLDRDVYLPDLGMSLTNHAVRLAEAGRRQEALPVSQEAVDLRRELAGLNRDAYLPDLGMSLANHAFLLAEIGRRQQALPVSQEAVDIYQELAELNRDAYLPDLAGSLNNHAVQLAEIGRRQEALPVSQEAVDLRRELVGLNRDAYLPDLGMSLTNHAVRLAEIGRRQQAVPVSQEAVDIYQELAGLNRDAYLPDLGMSLVNHAFLLAEIGRRQQAVPVSQEAVDIYQELAELNRDAYLPALTASLASYAVLLVETGRRQEAVPVSQEAVDLRRELAGLNRDAYLPDLAASLYNYASLLAQIGRRQQALPVSQEAVDIYQELAELNRDAYLPQLAISLNNHALWLVEIERRQEAVPISQEAVRLCRELAELNPDAYLPGYTRNLAILGHVLVENARLREALTPLIEAFQAAQELPEYAQGIIGTIVDLLRRAYAADAVAVTDEFRQLTDQEVPPWMKEPPSTDQN